MIQTTERPSHNGGAGGPIPPVPVKTFFAEDTPSRELSHGQGPRVARFNGGLESLAFRVYAFVMVLL